MDCKVIVMNANGCIPKDLKIGDMEIPKKRKDVRQKVIKDENPDLILIQESDIVLRNICTQDFGDRNYQAIGGKDTGIIFDTTTFIRFEDPTNKLRQIYEFKLVKGEISSTEILPRMCAVILKERNSIFAQPFLCVSWHGPYKMNLVQKTLLFYDLCFLIKTYLMERQIPVIWGGDFNLDLYKHIPQPYILSPPVLQLHDYETLEHRPCKIDYIITSFTIINVIDCCKPINVYKIIKDLFPDLQSDYYKAVLDHDPLVVNVSLPKMMICVPTPLQNNAILSNPSNLFWL